MRRVYRLRVLGLGLGMFCIAPVLWLQGSGWWWLLLACNGLGWPHVARHLAQRSAVPRRAEQRNLMIDSALTGMWVAVIQFNLLPSVLLLAMLSAGKISAGGPRFFGRPLACVLAACVATTAALGFPVSLATPMAVVLGCLPLLVAYPLSISLSCHALASRILRQNRRLDERGRTDDLTGLANRRHGLAVAGAELTRARETGRPVSLILLALDHFKRINDVHGLPVGDAVLRGVALALRSSSRGGSDTPVRHGGDEFILILPDTNLDGAEETAARVRANIEGLVFEKAPNLRCTVSVGAAQASPRAEDLEAWIQRADLALNVRKAAGRDKSVHRSTARVA